MLNEKKTIECNACKNEQYPTIKIAKCDKKRNTAHACDHSKSIDKLSRKTMHTHTHTHNTRLLFKCVCYN